MYQTIFDDVLFPIYLNGGWGYYHKEKCRVEISPRFEEVGYFSCGLAPVNHNGKWGYINVHGDWVIPPKYDEAQNFSEMLAWVQSENKNLLIDHSDAVVKSYPSDTYEIFDMFIEGYCCISSNGLHGYVDRKGNILGKIEYESTSSFMDGMALIKRESKSSYEYLTTEGKIWSPKDYPVCSAFSEGLAQWLDEESWSYGYYNQEGTAVIPNIFNDAWFFSENLAAVSQKGRYGYINRQGEIQIPMQYDEAYSFISERALVIQKGNHIFINKLGMRASDLGKWDSVDMQWYTQFPDLIRMVKKGESYYIRRTTGDLIYKDKRIF